VADSLAAVGEAISGLPVVRAYGAEDATLARVRRALDGQFRAEFRANRLGAFLFSSAELFAGLITAAVIGVGVWLGAGRGVSAGNLLAFLFLVNLLVEPVQMVVETLDLAQSAGAGVRRILGVLDTAVDVPDPVDGVDLPDGELDVDFEGVRFRYPTGPDVLSDLTVRIPDGTRVAVVGETGSGKTTFAKLVTRLLDPAEGWVIIGGVPLNRVRFASLRRRVAFVPQEGFLFDATVGDNVRYGKPEATDAEVSAAFAELGLNDWLEQLPAGLDTPVGERGGRLSVGERQLVALVRAWIADPALLVLDEATSAVDPALEVRLRRAIERLTGGRTSITVAHRLSTAEAADEVLVFERGRLVERGRHDELLAQEGAYAALHADWAAGTKNL
jgi:putative ABC transport system ATP-binding protein